MQLTVILSMMFAIFIAIFAGLNSNVVEVNLLFVKSELSQAIVILISAIFGAALMYLLNFFKSLKKSNEIRTLRKSNEKLQQEINILSEKNNEVEQVVINDDLPENLESIEE
jgi:uncharacterized integral membrane protein